MRISGILMLECIVPKPGVCRFDQAAILKPSTRRGYVRIHIRRRNSPLFEESPWACSIF